LRSDAGGNIDGMFIKGGGEKEEFGIRQGLFVWCVKIVVWFWGGH
jgi:hypothetical protein